MGEVSYLFNPPLPTDTLFYGNSPNNTVTPTKNGKNVGAEVTIDFGADTFATFCGFGGIIVRKTQVYCSSGPSG